MKILKVLLILLIVLGVAGLGYWYVTSKLKKPGEATPALSENQIDEGLAKVEAEAEVLDEVGMPVDDATEEELGAELDKLDLTGSGDLKELDSLQ